MNKQIKEMAHLVCERDAEDICTLDRKQCDLKCTSGDIAKHLYSHGYRKASDVARAIFAEIDKTAYGDMDFFKMLKKKYESEGAE